ncbi:hypothetical protein BB560_000314 [Smittium megazygosporum]|uniref:TEA domain-containing protein n=1 Tax=Smittium megazygosporum TaxID=133381 RepID=A0A2T9ZKU6_9FUNG|nr:hypothetical protein BB560_000314 [Smittium megazygosporum]
MELHEIKEILSEFKMEEYILASKNKIDGEVWSEVAEYHFLIGNKRFFHRFIHFAIDLFSQIGQKKYQLDDNSKVFCTWTNTSFCGGEFFFLRLVYCFLFLELVGRNDIISRYIFMKSKIYRARKQVSSHIQVWANCKKAPCSREMDVNVFRKLSANFRAFYVRISGINISSKKMLGNKRRRKDAVVGGSIAESSDLLQNKKPRIENAELGANSSALLLFSSSTSGFGNNGNGLSRNEGTDLEVAIKELKLSEKEKNYLKMLFRIGISRPISMMVNTQQPQLFQNVYQQQMANREFIPLNSSLSQHCMYNNTASSLIQPQLQGSSFLNSFSKMDYPQSSIPVPINSLVSNRYPPIPEKISKLASIPLELPDTADSRNRMSYVSKPGLNHSDDIQVFNELKRSMYEQQELGKHYQIGTPNMSISTSMPTLLNNNSKMVPVQLLHPAAEKLDITKDSSYQFINQTKFLNNRPASLENKFMTHENMFMSNSPSNANVYGNYTENKQKGFTSPGNMFSNIYAKEDLLKSANILDFSDKKSLQKTLDQIKNTNNMLQGDIESQFSKNNVDIRKVQSSNYEDFSQNKIQSINPEFLPQNGFSSLFQEKNNENFIEPLFKNLIDIGINEKDLNNIENMSGNNIYSGNYNNTQNQARSAIQGANYINKIDSSEINIDLSSLNKNIFQQDTDKPQRFNPISSATTLQDSYNDNLLANINYLDNILDNSYTFDQKKFLDINESIMSSYDISEIFKIIGNKGFNGEGKATSELNKQTQIISNLKSNVQSEVDTFANYEYRQPFNQSRAEQVGESCFETSYLTSPKSSLANEKSSFENKTYEDKNNPNSKLFNGTSSTLLSPSSLQNEPISFSSLPMLLEQNKMMGNLDGFLSVENSVDAQGLTLEKMKALAEGFTKSEKNNMDSASLEESDDTSLFISKLISSMEENQFNENIEEQAKWIDILFRNKISSEVTKFNEDAQLNYISLNSDNSNINDLTPIQDLSQVRFESIANNVSFNDSKIDATRYVNEANSHSESLPNTINPTIFKNSFKFFT